MVTLNFSILISVDKATVWNLMLQDKSYREWTSEFHEGSFYEGTWETGTEMRFLGPNDDGTLGGMYSRIRENRQFEYLSLEHLGLIVNGKIDTETDEARKWASAFENYTFISEGTNTRLAVSLQVLPEYQQMFTEMWNRALATFKRICER